MEGSTYDRGIRDKRIYTSQQEFFTEIIKYEVIFTFYKIKYLFLI